jgi:hypothetical protein
LGADFNLLNYRVRLRLQRIGRFQRFTGSVAGRRPMYVLDEFPHDLTEANARLRIRDMQRRRGPALAFLPDDSIDSPFPAGNALANVGRSVIRTADRMEGHLSASAVSHFMGVMKQEPNLRLDWRANWNVSQARSRLRGDLPEARFWPTSGLLTIRESV